MKKVFVTLLTLTLCTTLSHAQKIDWGAKAGLNYNFGGDLSEAPASISDSFENVITGADSKAGYHFGFMD